MYYLIASMLLACPCEDCTCKPCSCEVSYAGAYRTAIRENKPLLVFVHQAPKAIDGCIVCRWDGFRNDSMPCVVGGLPDGNGAIDQIFLRDSYPTRQWLIQAVAEARAKKLARELARQPARFVPTFAPMTLRGGSGSC